MPVAVTNMPAKRPVVLGEMFVITEEPLDMSPVNTTEAAAVISSLLVIVAL